jgi:hypothetical protein
MIHVPQQGINRRLSARGIRAFPPIRAEAGPRLAFGLPSNVVNSLVAYRRAGAFGHSVLCTENPRHPCVVTLERRRGGEDGHPVHEGDLVLEIPEQGDALTTNAIA